VNRSTRVLGLVFGLLAAALLALAALISAILGIVALVGAGVPYGLSSGATAIVEFVLAILTALFAVLGAQREREFALPGGIVLIVLALAEWFVFDFGHHLLVLLAGLFSIVAGLLFAVGRR
jgi:hypothetical protein